MLSGLCLCVDGCQSLQNNRKLVSLVGCFCIIACSDMFFQPAVDRAKTLIETVFCVLSVLAGFIEVLRQICDDFFTVVGSTNCGIQFFW